MYVIRHECERDQATIASDEAIGERKQHGIADRLSEAMFLCLRARRDVEDGAGQIDSTVAWHHSRVQLSV